ncbi:MAG: hypothetical protein KIT54_05975 [Phycisphaeraceae bacterium]|nr:hypothetical protein [Phycisphaeraceae bacterium]
MFPLPSEAWIVVVAIAAIGILATLLTMAAAIRQGIALIHLENRVRLLRAQQRQAMIDRGLIEADPEAIEADEVVDMIDAPGEPQNPGRAA